MVYTRGWDETDPDGAVVNANDIDAEIRQLKQDIRQRLETVSSFGTDTDPLELDEGTARLTTDTNANRPTNPTLDGEAYYETDTGKLFVSVPDGGGGLKWEEVSGSAAATTSGITTALMAAYNANTGSVVEEVQIVKLLAVTITGTTDGSGHLVIDLDDFSEAFDLTNTLQPGDPDAGNKVKVLTSTLKSGAAARVNSVDTGLNELTFEILDFSGSPAVSTGVSLTILLAFKAP